MKDVVDSSFSNKRIHDGHNKESKDCGHGHGHVHERGRDNTSQTYDNANHEKDKSMIKCYTYEKI